MGKKRTGGGRAGVEHVPKVKSRKSTKHVEALGAIPRAELNDFFEIGPPDKLLEVFDESYSADLVNLLLDLKKSAVKRFIDIVSAARKRAVLELATLYHYKEYLTNPLPLRVETESGQSIPNFYAILGVPREVSEDDLKTAYRLLVKAYSPEAFSPAMRKAGGDRLAEIHDAYGNLKSPQKRQKADRLLPNINYLYPRRDQSWLEAVLRLSA